jgi:pimeloyl-ACP methyl ester carboxylesterase
MKKAILILLFIVHCSLFTVHCNAQVPNGSYEGHITYSLGELAIIVNFNAINDSLKATIDIPLQGARKIELKNVKFTDPNIYFELPAGPGLAKFDGKVMKDSIVGSFTQGAVVGTFKLLKTKAEDTLTKQKLPYKEEAVTFASDGNTLAGTLSIPEGTGKHPAIIMISGSGANNRDEEIYGFKLFKIIADHLSRYGIAVLRYDKRGVGESKGKSVSESTTMDFAGDVEKAVQYLKTRNDIDTTKIGLFGHSEGGVIAPIVASRNKDIDFIILMAGPAVKADEVLNEQKRLIMQLAGSSKEEINKAIQMNKDVFNATRTGKGMDKIKKQMKDEVKAKFVNDSSKNKQTDAELDAAIDAQLKRYESVWWKYFIDFDPKPYLEKVNCPVLALFGELDVQVPAKQSEQPMRDALKKAGNKDVTINIIPTANHLFQEAKTGNIDEYAMLKHEFAPGFLIQISEWTRRVCKLTN